MQPGPRGDAMPYAVTSGFTHPPVRRVPGSAASVGSLGGCLMCGRPVAAVDEHVRLRGDLYVHATCATYQRRPGL